MKKTNKINPLAAHATPSGSRLSKYIGPLLNPLCLALLAAVWGCTAETQPGTENDDDANDTFSAQVERGGELYGQHCAHCHGDSGQGTSDAPAVVGPDALPLDPPAERQVRANQFRTAADVYVFASENMPGDDPGSLDDANMVDILAFALSANGVVLDEPLSLENASSIILHEE